MTPVSHVADSQEAPIDIESPRLHNRTRWSEPVSDPLGYRLDSFPGTLDAFWTRNRHADRSEACVSIRSSAPVSASVSAG